MGSSYRRGITIRFCICRPALLQTPEYDPGFDRTEVVAAKQRASWRLVQELFSNFLFGHIELVALTEKIYQEIQGHPFCHFSRWLLSCGSTV